MQVTSEGHSSGKRGPKRHVAQAGRDSHHVVIISNLGGLKYGPDVGALYVTPVPLCIRDLNVTLAAEERLKTPWEKEGKTDGPVRNAFYSVLNLVPAHSGRGTWGALAPEVRETSRPPCSIPGEGVTLATLAVGLKESEFSLLPTPALEDWREGRLGQSVLGAAVARHGLPISGYFWAAAQTIWWFHVLFAFVFIVQCAPQAHNVPSNQPGLWARGTAPWGCRGTATVTTPVPYQGSTAPHLEVSVERCGRCTGPGARRGRGLSCGKSRSIRAADAPESPPNSGRIDAEGSHSFYSNTVLSAFEYPSGFLS